MNDGLLKIILTKQTGRTADDVVNLLLGLQVCRICKGAGCSNCYSGIVPYDNPLYASGKIALMGDIVVFPTQRIAPAATHGILTGWNIATSIAAVIIMRHQQRLDILEIPIELLELVRRA